MNGGQPAITVAISRDQAFHLLQQLAQDDAVRDAIAADPGPELEARGIIVSPELLPREAKLASKEEIAELLFVLGDDPEDTFGRPKGEAWPYHMLCIIFRFGALPFARREAERYGAP